MITRVFLTFNRRYEPPISVLVAQVMVLDDKPYCRVCKRIKQASYDKKIVTKNDPFTCLLDAERKTFGETPISM